MNRQITLKGNLYTETAIILSSILDSLHVMAKSIPDLEGPTGNLRIVDHLERFIVEFPGVNLPAAIGLLYYHNLIATTE